MIYRKLFDWIDGDDACEITSITLYSGHDTGHEEEKDFIIRRLKSLLETGVTIQNIVLYLCPQYDHPRYLQQIPDNYLQDPDALAKHIDSLYSNGVTFKTMTISVKIEEDHH
tara:strand:- start:284 stop:619 length:336 start_codon:yes stop_codon:yes gene_type:complete